MEVVGLAPALVIADHVVKAAAVSIVGVEGDAGQQCLVKFVGDASSCAQAVETAKQIAASMHAGFHVSLRLNFDDPAAAPLVHTAQEYSGISQGNLHMLPHETATDDVRSGSAAAVDHAEHTKRKVARERAMQAIGILETQGLTGVIEGADAMCKAANVEIVGKEKIGAAHVTVFIRGDVAAVQAAIEAGKQAAAKVGTLVAAHVIARPHAELAKLLP